MVTDLKILILVDLLIVGVVELVDVMGEWRKGRKGWVDEGRAMLLLFKMDRVDIVII